MSALDGGETPLGDSHNFGQRVSFLQSSRLQVLKPRTVFWENLFLNHQSDFRIAMRKTVGTDFDRVLGHIEIQPKSDYLSGAAGFVASAGSQSPSFVHLGELIAMALIFGFTDLHRGNLVILNGAIQVVDLECVFWDSELPSESMLVHSQEVHRHKTLIGHCGPESLGAGEIAALAQGYTRLFELILSKQEVVREFFDGTAELSRHPVRLLLRETKVYQDYLNGITASKTPWLPEELEQLGRKDVPYFWGYLGQSDVWYFREPSVAVKVGVIDQEFAAKVNRAFKLPATLLSAVRLQRIFRQGVIEIIYRLADRSKFPIAAESLRASIVGGYLRVQTPAFSVQAVIR